MGWLTPPERRALGGLLRELRAGRSVELVALEYGALGAALDQLRHRLPCSTGWLLAVERGAAPISRRQLTRLAGALGFELEEVLVYLQGRVERREMLRAARNAAKNRPPRGAERGGDKIAILPTAENT